MLSLSLSACFLNDTPSDKTNSYVYSLISEEETIDFDNHPGTAITYRTLKGEELNPYLTIKDYLSMLKPIKKEGYKFTISSNYGIFSIVVSSEEGNLFVTQINTSSKKIMMNGDFSSALTTEPDLSKSSLMIGLKNDYEAAGDSASILMMDYGAVGYKTFNSQGQYYFPLSLLERIFSSASGVYHLFNYKRIVQFTDNDMLNKKQYIVDGQTIKSSNEEMRDFIDSELDYVMPNYLIRDRFSSFLFIMEYQYGLKTTRKISSMMKYLNEQYFFKNFVSTDIAKRTDAYYQTIALLDDGHTSVRDGILFPWYQEVGVSPTGEYVSSIVNIRQRLLQARTLTPGEIHYSNDEKLAFLSFDSFSFTFDAYNEDGSLKEGLSDYHSEDYDTFFYLVKMLNQIKEKGGVEDVVIDISCNGGGTIGVLMKLIPLLSKDNTGVMYLKSDLTNMTTKMNLLCDSNNDEKYDEKDCYGNDFKFHILTSGFSFSCGNAFPFFLQKAGYAEIIGVKSGGGECTVQEAYLPSGEWLYHSSTNHMGWFEDKTFYGDEGGAPVDKAVKYDDFYNLEKLQEIIKQ